MSHDIELLAPAGNLMALHAAVRGGCDAVYLGLEAFNARRGADNFTLEELPSVCEWVHIRGVRLYITFNTIILPDEILQVLELARQAYRAGVDAFIVQDIGLAGELSRILPLAHLHISTQMNIHNEAGIVAAARLGAHRITLARELSVAEIAHLSHIAHQYNIEIETFAHGALCVCYSGQCFMSSLIGTRSANRGLCTQACRLPYELHNKALRKNLPAPGKHLLSPQDLCTIDMLAELLEAGVTSLKIEGRMKSPEYVYAVTSTYRHVLDRVCQWRMDRSVGEAPQATDEEHRILAEAFSRGFTTAYLHGKRGNDIMSYSRPNNRGVFVGRVVSVKEGVASLHLECDLARGDVLEFWTNKGHFTHVLDAISYDNDKNLLVVLQHATNKGDRIFCVRRACATFEDDEFSPRVPVRGYVRLRIGLPLQVEFSPATTAPSSVFRSTKECAPDDIGVCARGVYVGDVVEAAHTRSVSTEEVYAHINRLGQTPFSLAFLDVELDQGVGISFSQLHRARQAALNDLTRNMLAATRTRVLSRTEPRHMMPPVHPRGLRIAAWVTNPACACAAKRAGADIIYVPAIHYRRGEAFVAGQRSQTVEQTGYPKQVVIAMPTIDHDCVPLKREALGDFNPWDYVRQGKPVFVDSLGALIRALDLGAEVEVGPHLPITNSLALDTAAAFGARRVWLSPELTLNQISLLAKSSPVELGLVVAGSQELMITEHCLLMSQGSCNQDCDVCPRRKSPHYLRDRKGFEFPIVTDMYGRSHLYNAVPLDVVHKMPDLVHAGLSVLMVDTSLMNVEETKQAVSRVVRARAIANTGQNTLAKTPDTTSGHLFRGVR